VTPEAARLLARAREDLSDASQIMQIGLARVAARSAYYVAFHAAEAFIVEQTGRIARTHAGVRREFARLAKDDGRVAQGMTTFLAQAYEYKEVSDYNVDPKAVVTMQNAETAIARATDFLDRIEAILA
jgi:uncharacterized protein (UPF0332 family)